MTDPEIDLQALARFRFLLRQFFAFSAEQARAVGLEPRQHQLLLSLCGLPTATPPTIGALAQQLLIRHHSAAELVTRMERRGLVRRRADDDDGRVVLVEITSQGQELLGQLSRTHRDQLLESGPALVAALQEVIAAGAPERGAGEAPVAKGEAAR